MALLLGTIAGVLLGLEGLTRLCTHVVPPLLVNDPAVGMTYCPGYSGAVYVPESQREVFLRFNRDGLRGPDVPYEKPPGVCRVAVIGDSMIAAIATDEEKTLVRLLEQRLNRSSATGPFEVMNCGISGSNTAQELLLYRKILRDYRPDIVVCAVCVANDLGDNCQRLTSNRGRIYFDIDEAGQLFQLPMMPGRAALNSWLNRHSRFYVWQKDATQRAINTIRGKAIGLAAFAGHEVVGVNSGGTGIFCTQPGDNLQHAWQITEKLLAALRDDVQRDGADFVVALIPSGFQVYDDTWHLVEEAAAGQATDPRFPDERFAEIGRRLSVPVVVMTEDFRAAAPHHSAEFDEEYLHYGAQGHLNDRGNDIGADVLCRAVLERAPSVVARRADRVVR